MRSIRAWTCSECCSLMWYNVILYNNICLFFFSFVRLFRWFSHSHVWIRGSYFSVLMKLCTFTLLSPHFMSYCVLRKKTQTTTNMSKNITFCLIEKSNSIRIQAYENSSKILCILLLTLMLFSTASFFLCLPIYFFFCVALWRLWYSA